MDKMVLFTLTNLFFAFSFGQLNGILLYSPRYGSKDMLSLHKFSVIRSNTCCCISLVVHSVVVIRMLSVLNKLQRLCRNISFSLKKTSTILRILIFVFFIYTLLTATGYQGELSITFVA